MYHTNVLKSATQITASFSTNFPCSSRLLLFHTVDLLSSVKIEEFQMIEQFAID
jgi:hypothetical protein